MVVLTQVIIGEIKASKPKLCVSISQIVCLQTTIIKIRINESSFTRLSTAYDIKETSFIHLFTAYDIKESSFTHLFTAYDIKESSFIYLFTSHDMKESSFMSYVVVDDIKDVFLPILTCRMT